MGNVPSAVVVTGNIRDHIAAADARLTETHKEIMNQGLDVQPLNKLRAAGGLNTDTASLDLLGQVASHKLGLPFVVDAVMACLGGAQSPLDTPPKTPPQRPLESRKKSQTFAANKPTTPNQLPALPVPFARIKRKTDTERRLKARAQQNANSVLFARVEDTRALTGMQAKALNGGNPNDIKIPNGPNSWLPQTLPEPILRPDYYPKQQPRRTFALG